MKLKRHISFTMLAVLLAVTASLGAIAVAYAQQGRIDAFTYFIPYPADQLDDQFDVGASSFNFIGDDIETTISIAVHRTGTVIYYDQWEDGLEADLTSPTQSSTAIWGDGDPSNNQGIAIPNGDNLTAGDVIVLSNEVVVENDATGTRDPNKVFFDGGDALTALNGAIAVTLAVWPVHGPPPSTQIRFRYAGAWELYPTNQWGTNYTIPIGQNLDGTGPNQRLGFEVVGLNVQAVQDGTTVDLDLDGDGTFEETNLSLNYGGQLTRVSGVNSGAQVRASNPVQVHVFTSDRDRTYEARAYTMVPREQWIRDYLAPRSSDGDFWFYNPNGADIQITAQTDTGSSNFTVPAGTTRRYPVPPAGLITTRTGVRFTSTDGDFYGVAALDAAQDQDWGYALQPVNRLTSQALIGWGPSHRPPPAGGNESRVYVTTLSATDIFVDFDNDGTIDRTVNVAPLTEVSITDTVDLDMTGALLYTSGTPFVSVWGQDQDANPGAPSIDVGTSIVPLTSLAVQKTFQLVEEADCTGSITLGDTIRFRLEYLNNAAFDISEVKLQDTLSPALTYVPNSIVHRGSSVPDATGTALFQGSGFDAGTLGTGATADLTFDAIINNASAPITNQATASSKDVSIDDTVIVLVPTAVITPILQVNKTLIDPPGGVANVGQVVTFSLTITNTSGITITKLPIRDTFDDTYLTFRSASPVNPDVQATGVISWTDLVPTFGVLTPTKTISLLISFTVDQVPPGNSTSTRGTVFRAERSDGQAPLVCYNDALVSVAAAAAPPPSGGGDSGGGEPSPPTPTPTPIPATPVAQLAVPVATPSGLPVTILPETGIREKTNTGRPVFGILAAVLAVIGIGAKILYTTTRKSG